MMRMTRVLVLSLVLATCLCGCNARNAELKEWDVEGNLVRQVRYGQVNLLYWFSLNDGAIIYDPNSHGFSVTAGMINEKPDPESIRATGEAIGAGMREFVNLKYSGE